MQEVWRLGSQVYNSHFKGGRYLVLHVALNEKDGEALVVYVSLTDGVIWARPLCEWDDGLDYEGREVTRFVRDV